MNRGSFFTSIEKKMKTNKKNFYYSLIIGGAIILSALVFKVTFDGDARNVRGASSDIVNCDAYFDPANGYTSLYEVISDLNASQADGLYKTWGTVTKYYLDSNNYKNFYMQSTDQLGNAAGIMIYQSNVAVSEGSVLTIEGYPTLYNNLPEFVSPTINVDYDVNSSPVTTYQTDSAFWQNGTNRYSLEFLSAQSRGTIKIALQDVLLTSINSGNATATISGTVTVPLYYAYLNNTSDIYNAITSLNGYTVDLVGYLHCFDNGYNPKMQFLLRSPSDISSEGIEYSLLLNTDSNYQIGTYPTGNYDSVYSSGFYFEHYRAINSADYEGEFIVLLPYVNSSGDGSAPGAFYNTSSINAMQSISITYRTESLYGTKPVLSYGSSPLRENESELDLSTTATTYSINVDDTNFFKIETGGTRLFIHEISIDYTNENPASDFEYLSSGLNDARINPLTSSGDLYDGKSFTVPTSILQSGSNYTVNATKTYTYYSYSYFASYPSLVEEAAYISPSDVAAFYTIFGTYPSNFVARSNYYSAYSIFGDKTRCVSSYSRTDGYATTVPYQADIDGYPLYFECDIALTPDYSPNNRGVGRLVCWTYGFDQEKGAVNYDSSPVCVYTDDHYATFAEYLNHGSFGRRFNAEMSPTEYVWGAATTLFPL